MNEHEVRLMYSKYEAAKERREMLGMRNTNGLSSEERATLDMEYQTALEECNRAYFDYIDAHKSCLKGKHDLPSDFPEQQPKQNQDA